MNKTCLSVLALAASLWQAGCGPGTGGTGGGETAALGYFGASLASVCASAIAGQLACAPGSASSSGDLLGSDLVLLDEAASGHNTSASVVGNHIELLARCASLSFAGDWGQAHSGEQRYWGQVRRGVQEAQYASLSLQATGTGNRMVAVLRDAAGQTLLGPVLLDRVGSPPPPPGACPS